METPRELSDDFKSLQQKLIKPARVWEFSHIILGIFIAGTTAIVGAVGEFGIDLNGVALSRWLTGAVAAVAAATTLLNPGEKARNYSVARGLLHRAKNRWQDADIPDDHFETGYLSKKMNEALDVAAGKDPK